MSNETRDAQFERRAGQVLRDSVGQLDAQTRSRLTRARHAALEQWQTPRHSWRGWAPAGVLAAGLLATLLFMRQHSPGLLSNPAGALDDDMELLADADALELNAGLDGDETAYDFYEWAAARSPATDPP